MPVGAAQVPVVGTPVEAAWVEDLVAAEMVEWREVARVEHEAVQTAESQEAERVAEREAVMAAAMVEAVMAEAPVAGVREGTGEADAKEVQRAARTAAVMVVAVAWTAEERVVVEAREGGRSGQERWRMATYCQNLRSRSRMTSQQYLQAPTLTQLAQASLCPSLSWHPYQSQTPAPPKI